MSLIVCELRDPRQRAADSLLFGLKSVRRKGIALKTVQAVTALEPVLVLAWNYKDGKIAPATLALSCRGTQATTSCTGRHSTCRAVERPSSVSGQPRLHYRICLLTGWHARLDGIDQIDREDGAMIVSRMVRLWQTMSNRADKGMHVYGDSVELESPQDHSLSKSTATRLVVDPPYANTC